MRVKTHWILFSLCLFLTLFSPAFLPAIRLIPFTAFLAYIMTKNDLKAAICYGFLCGLIMDFFSSDLRLGCYSLIYILATIFIYGQKWLILHDKLFSIALHTFVLSIFLSIATWAVKSLVSPKGLFSFIDLLKETLVLSMFDALFAFICITAPEKLYKILRKKGIHFKFLKGL